MSTNNASPQPVLLPTKLYIPHARTDVVQRPRLTGRLNDGIGRKLTLISAPAGFGKTTLLGEWIPQSARCVTWVSLDQSDNDVPRFLSYVIAALQMLQRNLGEKTGALLAAPQSPAPETILSTLIAEIATFPDAFALALDDYHVIEAQPVHQALTFIIENLPRNMHLAIATRSDPPLPLARLRARGQVTELRAADLRFTVAESAAFLNDVMKIGVEEKDIAALDQRTEGWIAGLQLAALSMQGRDDVSAFIKAFTGDDRHVLDYLVEEVFQRQPEHVQNFLLQTSILNRMSAALCDAVTERPGSQDMLMNLEQANLFIFPLDNVRQWYRYHHLFADLLRFRLQKSQPETVAGLHRRASACFEANGFIEDAIHHALAAKEWDRAALLIETVALQMLVSWRQGILMNWVKSLPEQALDKRPNLCLWYAFVFLHNANYDACEPLLQKAEQAWQRDPRDHKLFAVWSARAMIAFSRADATACIEAGQKAVAVAHPENLLEHAMSTLALGFGYLANGRYREAEASLGEAIAASERIGHHIVFLASMMWLSLVQMTLGKLRQAKETLLRAQQFGSLQIPVPAIQSHGLLCALETEWNNLDTAERHARTSLDVERRSRGDWVFILDVVKAVARVLWQRGEKNETTQFIDRQVENAKKHRNELFIRQMKAFHAQLALWENNLSAASRWAEASHLQNDDQFTFFRETEFLTFARVLLAQAKYDEAISLLNRLQRAAESDGRLRSLLEISALKAVTHRNQGQQQSALTALERALTFGEPEGYIRTFVDEGAPMVELLRDFVREKQKERASDSRRVLQSYVMKLLAAFPPELVPVAVQSHKTSADLPRSYLLDPLSERELEVLKLVADGLSNERIGRKLFLATSTVKRHINNIYGKLEVHSRTQAVAKGRELKLLSEDQDEDSG